jgi:hypothetical protein
MTKVVWDKAISRSNYAHITHLLEDLLLGQVSPYPPLSLEAQLPSSQTSISCAIRRWIYIVSQQLITQTLMRVGSPILTWQNRIDSDITTPLWGWNPNKSGTS